MRTDYDSGEGLPKPAHFDAASAALSEKASERFVFQKLLGKGASGAVYQALDKTRGATVAVKFLTALDPGSLFRFKSEFRTLTNLVHPNLLQLYELLTYDDDWLLTMELVEGTDFYSFVTPTISNATAQTALESQAEDADTADLTEEASEATHRLSDKIDEELESTFISTSPAKGFSMPPTVRPPSARRALTSEITVCPFDEERLRNALLQLCRGLTALHRADRLHRDLKPANVLVSVADARVVICDFGLALEGTMHRDDPLGAPDEERSVDSRFESRHREVAGTLVFMSPEQARAETLTAASDWYSVGVMLYQALTGRLPFTSSLSYHAAVKAKLRVRPVHPAALFPGVPGELAELALALLNPDPRQRAGNSEVLRALEGPSKRAVRRVRTSRAFIGRDVQLGMLESAFLASRSGAATIALVSGSSGMGKSSLVQHFLAHLENDEHAIVLRARCYEREELPYKAIDPLIDALSSHLLGLDHERVKALVPKATKYLAALFPALRRVRAIAELRDDTTEVVDPRERRRLAFRSFRTLCEHLALERPLVLFIDDLQWGDRDSAPLFQELVMSPDAPAVMVVCAYRSEDEDRSALLKLLKDMHALDESVLRLVEVKVEALSLVDATRLAAAMLDSRPGAEAAAELIAREAQGSPFFVRELAAYISERGIEATTRIRLDTLIQAQLDALMRDSRDLLSMIAVAGRPMSQTTVRLATKLGPSMFKALRDLEARRLVLTTREGDDERVECYHDRIREAAYQALAIDQTRALHRALAEALESEPLEDCDALLEHWRAAGERDKARHYAERGAQRAEVALAFARAADLYREALSLLPATDSKRPALQEHMGHALMLAGRGVDAAAAFQELIPGATASEALKYRMLATTQLLRGGKIADGFAELARAHDLFGVRMPRSEAAGLAMLVSRQLRIRWNEKNIVINPTDGRDAERDKLVALWEVAAAVSSADWLLGSIYGAELLLRAIEVGDPSHIAGACGLEAVTAAAGNKVERAQRMIDIAEQAAGVTGRVDLIGRVRGMRAVCCQLLGRWRESVSLARESQELQRRAAQVTWDLAIMTWWEITSAAFAGYISELTELVPTALRDAEARGDVFAATSFRTHRCSWAWLALDRASVADHHVDVAEREWTPNGYQFQHWHMTYARSDIDLYRGRPQPSLERLNQVWKRGRLLRQVHGVRVDMLYTRARLALAVAQHAWQPSLQKLAIDDARTLHRENTPWARALGTLLIACAASFDSKHEALRLLAEAEQQFAVTDMALHVEVCKLRRGELMGGTEGRARVDAALERIRTLGVKQPGNFVQMLAPFGA